MKLSINEALKKGIKAHKAGQHQEADKFYSSILQSQPKHPDANHNMGVLAVGIGKPQEALPFFKTALEADQSITQFWLSYIDALIRLERIADAKAVLHQAKEKGAKGEAFDRLEEQFSDLVQPENEFSAIKNGAANSLWPNILDTVKLGKALKLAKQKSKEGLISEAKNIYEDILKKHPLNKKTLSGLKSLDRGGPKDPPQNLLQPLINLYSQGQLQHALFQASHLQQQFPNSVVLYNILGATNAGLRNFEAAIDSFKQALRIKPDFAEAYYNMGDVQSEGGDSGAAIDSYKQALKIKPDFAEAYYNMGIALHHQGDLGAAIASYKQALKNRPDDLDVLFSLGIAYNQIGGRDKALIKFGKTHDLIRGKNPADPFHKSFQIISKAKIDHDIEQFEYLADSGYEVKKFKELAQLYRGVSSEIDWPSHVARLPLDKIHQGLLNATYNRPIHVLEAPELEGSTLSDTLDTRRISESYFEHDHGLTHIDNFLTPIALESIRKYLLGSTIWFDLFHDGGYLGAYLKDGLACPLILQIADDLRNNFPQIFKNHGLKQLWAYKYDSRAYKENNSLTGIRAHADQAAVNVNFWITPNDANLNSSSGGLIVYNSEAPLEWGFDKFNNEQEALAKHLEASNGEKAIVPYNENRAVLFNSNLIHETDRFEFKEEYECRRINVTMLFGDRNTLREENSQ